MILVVFWFPRSKINLFQSSEGRQLRVARIGLDGAALKPAIFIDGGMHARWAKQGLANNQRRPFKSSLFFAREWASPAAVTYLLHKMVETKEMDAMLGKYDIYLLPLANPDGYDLKNKNLNLFIVKFSKIFV